MEYELQERNIEAMQDTIIEIYGFESLRTIWFFRVCEKYSYETIEDTFYRFTKGKVEV